MNTLEDLNNSTHERDKELADCVISNIDNFDKAVIKRLVGYSLSQLNDEDKYKALGLK